MPDVESVIVLMLENRSFDHMLGYLNHPSGNFGLSGSESNPWEPGEPPVAVSATARHTLPLDPAHGHVDVMMQLTGRSSVIRPYQINNQGFVVNFEHVGLKEKKRPGFGPQIMRCQPEASVPVLATLAKEFAVCTRWFCSVPGQTWPNRNFAHAATADGEVDINKRFYTNRTIFEQLLEAGRDWAVYHEGMCQVMAFRRVWMSLGKNRFHDHDDLLWAIQNDALPHYAFVEPDHFWPYAGSQHPGNNKKKGKDFRRAEALIGAIYKTLANNEEVFRKTLFVITYDEHGGFYDSVPPPHGDEYRDGHISEQGNFPFDLLGPRVPAVLVSPLIPRATVDETIYDHSSIPATLRALFAPGAPPLTPRDERANTFHHNLSLAAPRTGADLPQLPSGDPGEAAELTAVEDVEYAPDEDELDDFEQSLLWLTERVEAELREEGVEPERLGLPAMDPMIDDTNPASTAGQSTRQRQVMLMVKAAASPLVLLRLPDGEVVENPEPEEIQAAVADVLGTGEAMSSLRLRGPGPALLVLRGDASAQLVEGYSPPETAEGLDPAAVQSAASAFLEGDLAAVRAAIGRTS